MEITYHWEGDYLIPDLKLSDTTEYQIGHYFLRPALDAVHLLKPAKPVIGF